jgi:cerevisin
MNILDTPSYFSNSLPCIDVYAPGEDVLLTWVGSTTATHVLDSTSMATLHITGLVAYFLAHDESLRTPAAMKTLLTSTALPGVLNSRSGLVEGNTLILANNGETERRSLLLWLSLRRFGFRGLMRQAWNTVDLSGDLVTTTML